MTQDRFASADLKHGETNALVKIIGGADVVHQILRGEVTVTVTPRAESETKLKTEPSRIVLAGLLEEIGEPVKLPAIHRFVAREKFVVNREGELPISGLGTNFETSFLGVEEEAIPAATLKQRKLLKRSVDASILAALGDADVAKVEKALVALAHVFTYLKTANRKLWYIFYVADANGSAWAVLALWSDDGWGIEASSVRYPVEWNVEDHVVSR